MPSLLALDVSTSTGFAFFAGPDSMPKCGTWKVPKSWDIEDYGKRLAAFHNWLCDMLTTFQPDILAWESPVIPRAGMRDLKTSEHIMRTLIGLASVAELVGELRQIRCYEVHVATAKKMLAGHGRAEKHEMVSAAIGKGFSIADHHQADATAVALVVYDMLADD